MSEDDDYDDAFNEFIEMNAPKEIWVPEDGSEDDAAAAVQKQYEDAGFGCDRDTALVIVREARRK